jgi:hypothetical protein
MVSPVPMEAVAGVMLTTNPLSSRAAISLHRTHHHKPTASQQRRKREQNFEETGMISHDDLTPSQKIDTAPQLSERS